MSSPEKDSMWLQKSVCLADPLPNVGDASMTLTKDSTQQEFNAPTNRTTNASTTQATNTNTAATNAMPAPTVSSEKKRSVAVSEMELTRSTGECHLLNLPTSRVSSSMAYYPARMSVSHTAASSYLTAQHDVGDLRTRYQHAKRELLRLSNVQKDLDYSKLEMHRVQEEVKRLRESHRRVKQELAEASQRADAEQRMRVECETRIQEEATAHEDEVDFLRQQIESLRSEQVDRFAQMSAQQETEHTTRLNELHEELATLSSERMELVSQLEESKHLRDEAESRVQSAQNEVGLLRSAGEERQSKITALTDLLAQAESRVQSVLRQAQDEHAKELESQRSRSEAQREQLVVLKDRALADLDSEVRQLQEINRTLTAEMATLRFTIEQASQDRSQLQASQEKALRQLEESHRLALNEQQLRMESAVREAKGSRFALEEECHSLRRQVSTITAELAAVSATLSQREQSIHCHENEIRTLQEKREASRRESAQLQRELQLRESTLDEALQRVQHLLDQKDALEEELSKDVSEARDRARRLEEELRESRSELSELRTECVESEDAHREAMRRMRDDLDAARAAWRAALQQSNNDASNSNNNSGTAKSSATNMINNNSATTTTAAVQAEEYRRKYVSEKQKADSLNVELCAVIARCRSLEQQLLQQEQLSCLPGMTSSLTTATTTTTTSTANHGTESNNTSSTHLRASSCPPVAANLSARPPQLRSLSSTNTPSVHDSSKRARTEDARVFAISGFDGNEILLSIKQLPNVAIAECKSNMPVPSNLTHLVTNGQLTIKLLSALVRGCWVLPESYVTQSLKERGWASESEFGFQHEEPPLLKRRVTFTDAFTACKHYVTANLLIKEGGATVVQDTEQADMVLCTNNELEAIKKGMTWEMMVELIYPVRIE